MSYPGATSDWAHSRYESPALRQAQIGDRHVGILLYDGDGEEVDMGDGGEAPTNVTVRLRNPAYGGDRRMRMKVTRSEGGAELFDLSYGSVILGEALSEVTMLLPWRYVYGLGGHAFSFGHRVHSYFEGRTLYNLGQVTREGSQYALPTFVAMDSERNFFGVHVESPTPVTVQVDEKKVVSHNCGKTFTCFFYLFRCIPASTAPLTSTSLSWLSARWAATSSSTCSRAPPPRT